jgi:predicted dehydrogenase
VTPRVGEASTLRIGIAGFGRVAERFHLPALSRLASAGEAIRLDAVADPRAEARRSPALAGVRALASAEELVRSGLVDAVIVATPAETHAEVASVALRAGLPVLVEKPLARSIVEGEALRDAARSTGAALMVGFNRRHWDPVRVLASALGVTDGASGPGASASARTEARSGAVASARTAADAASGAPDPPMSARLVFDTDVRSWGAATGLGDALEDLVSHQLDLLRHLFRREIETVRAEPGADHRAVVAVRLGGGVRAECRASQRARYREEISVSRGEARWLLRSGSDRIAPAGTVRAALDAADRVRSRLGRRVPALSRSFDAQLRAFCAAVRTGAPPVPGLDDGLAVLRAVEAARRSAAAGGVEERP